MRKVAQITLTSFLMVWCLCGPLVWILRDGLGPDASESSGWEALRRFLFTFQWGPILIGLLAANIGIARLSNRPSSEASQNR